LSSVYDAAVVTTSTSSHSEGSSALNSSMSLSDRGRGLGIRCSDRYAVRARQDLPPSLPPPIQQRRREQTTGAAALGRAELRKDGRSTQGGRPKQPRRAAGAITTGGRSSFTARAAGSPSLCGVGTGLKRIRDGWLTKGTSVFYRCLSPHI
jgi:hypothetical protein